MPAGPAIVVLTGAGISAESGLSTFRDPQGIWARFDPAEVATPEGFARDPARVHAFYNLRRAEARRAAPNAAHLALARLEATRPAGEVLLVTQNVDDLHARAGSRALIAMHGRLAGALCAACGAHWEAPEVMSPADPCPECGRPATRPDVVWFGEMPCRMDEIGAALATCTLFAAIGTSGQVWPAAGFVAEARAGGAHCVEINLEESEVSRYFHEHRRGPASSVVPGWVAGLC